MPVGFRRSSSTKRHVVPTKKGTRNRVWVALFLCAACTGSGEDGETLTTQGGSTSIAFANLEGSADDLFVLSRERGVADAFFYENGAWQVTGNFFTGGEPIAAKGATVHGERTLIVLNVNRGDTLGLITLLPKDSGRAHVLRFPVSLSGMRVASAMAVFDLDRDGSDEVVYVGRRSLRVIYDLESALTVKEGGRPAVHEQIVDSTFDGGDIAAADINHDTIQDLIVLGAGEARARIFLGPFALGPTGSNAVTVSSVVDVTLPEKGREVLGSECRSYAAFVVSEAGSWLGVVAEDAIDLLSVSFAPIHAVDIVGTSMVTWGGTTPQLRISDPCSTRRGEIISSSDFTALALGQKTAGGIGGSVHFVATLSSRGDSVFVREMSR